ncbi:CorA metal ion transporter [Elasticomyces elasticus]|uniref:CorA metal ion transporter n=1 Tax=Exophiala sideris TaxID=1016849 RepID=A0ABR0JMB2_9EURO|nr:CorA metal ion transporter [Elasticomyces elasticus]KAK5024203.1 CorA metal ion transporter [Exophiala sideris]KAK5036718.1 CorA metal ion transporter [Exophiala sideris]KAK5067102.1 CorA metal ion transporter [Exophiala sideris]KAK5186724.1 CorA metal ion transporter [Eurotiomycetes sp. CCFEE 6388]
MDPSLANQPSTSASAAQSRPSVASTNPTDGKKRRKHRGGKKRRNNRRQSFAAPSDTSAMHSIADGPIDDPLIEESQQQQPAGRQTFYRNHTGNLSDESLDSEALLDHRNQPTPRPRRDSRLTQNFFTASYRSSTFPRPEAAPRRRHRSQQNVNSPPGSDDEEANDRTPLIHNTTPKKSPVEGGYGLFRRKSHTSSLSSTSRRQKKRVVPPSNSVPKSEQKDYDINNPPSVPASPTLGAHYGDVMVDDATFFGRSPDSRRNVHSTSKDALIDIDGDRDQDPNSAPPSPRHRPQGARHLGAVGDVCFPGDEASEAGDYYNRSLSRGPNLNGGRRRRRERDWPQTWILDDWSRAEKEERAAGERRVKKISEPVFVEGRLRPAKHAWHRDEEERQYRYTYFNEEFESTIHSETISELVQPGGDFRELFIPDPPELVDSDSSEDEEPVEASQNLERLSTLQSPQSQNESGEHTAAPSLAEAVRSKLEPNGKTTGKASPSPSPLKHTSKQVSQKPKRYGPRPTFWLDVLCPTDQEMRVLCKAFGIHALTSEDIMLQEAREKVELFRNYYFINYRTFEQDANSEDYLEPINMYMCVFRYGILTFHFSQIPHPANVRRRIRQLSDYLILSADWISYAIIDDITDVYQPLITTIEEEVDVLDDQILKSFQTTDELAGDHGEQKNEKDSDSDQPRISGSDMLLRIGECRKKVMSLYRLLGTKADVIKGFAKRCNEQWEVAPRSEIGLYLGDIQDHILTMTGNLSHYETLLSRAHGNYLAQVSIHMNERQEKTSDVLGKLTVLGTIVLPMNIVTGMFGGNFKVPGQEVDNLNWFWGTTAALLFFGIACYFWCKRVYKVV